MQFDVNQIKQAAKSLAVVWKSIEGNSWVSGSGLKQNYTQEITIPGMTLIGGGNFSAAFKLDGMPDVVIKFSPRKDDAYFHYALFCRQCPDAHAPKILHIEKMVEGYFVVMPEYAPYKDPIYIGRRHCGEFVNAREYASRIMCNPHEPVPMACVAKYPPSLGRFAKQVGMYFDGVGTIDLHDENVMWDGDTLIITDPVSYSYRSDKNEHKLRALEATLRPEPQRPQVGNWEPKANQPLQQAA